MCITSENVYAGEGTSCCHSASLRPATLCASHTAYGCTWDRMGRADACSVLLTRFGEHASRAVLLCRWIPFQEWPQKTEFAALRKLLEMEARQWNILRGWQIMTAAPLEICWSYSVLFANSCLQVPCPADDGQHNVHPSSYTCDILGWSGTALPGNSWPCLTTCSPLLDGGRAWLSSHRCSWSSCAHCLQVPNSAASAMRCDNIETNEHSLHEHWCLLWLLMVGRDQQARRRPAWKRPLAVLAAAKAASPRRCMLWRSRRLAACFRLVAGTAARWTRPSGGAGARAGRQCRPAAEAHAGHQGIRPAARNDGLHRETQQVGITH